MPSGLIFMTALLPTKGHKFLIDFAKTFLYEKNQNLGENLLYVIISSRVCEPIHGQTRVDAFREEFSSNSDQIIFKLHQDDDAPQNPKGDDDLEFWNYWKEIAHKYGNEHIDYVFASEPYGLNVAKSLGAQFIPCDIGRSTIDSKSSNVRKDIFGNFDKILPSMQRHFAQTVTIFGAESCGKTTTTKMLHRLHDSHIVLEWARTYLEAVGAELSEEKMLDIAFGQFSSQKEVYRLGEKPYIFQDTDLLSTIGYYKILGMEIPFALLSMFQETKSDFYIVMNSNIPFEEDILRYGGKVRESNDQFWIDLLEKFKCKYYVTKSSDFDERIVEINEQLNNLWSKFDPIKNFERE